MAAMTKGVKHDSGKPLAGLMVKDFAGALLAVSEVTTFGAGLYAPSNWRVVDNAEDRYWNAMIRHILDYAAGDTKDSDSRLPCLAHIAWNVLALLQFEVEKNGHALPGD